jgi:hypothetical protein
LPSDKIALKQKKKFRSFSILLLALAVSPSRWRKKLILLVSKIRKLP